MERYMEEGIMQQQIKTKTANPGGSQGKVSIVSNATHLLILVAISSVLAIAYLGWQFAVEGAGTETLLYAGIALVTLVLSAGMLRPFFIPLEPPKGRQITRDEAPRLFETLDKMCRKLGGPPIHHVVINRQYNTTVVPLRQRPISGDYTNYLVLGLPYMLGVPAKEMLSAIARDYSYLCDTHGKFAAKIFRQSRTLASLNEQIQRKSDVGRLEAVIFRAFGVFIKSYKKHTDFFLRQSGLAAEVASTKMFGPQIRANGMIRDALLRRWIREEFWAKLMKQAESHPRPTFMPFAAMRTAFDASYEDWATRERLTEVWLAKPGLDDTDLTLRERVEAIGQPGMLPARVKVTAAAALLEEAARRIIEEFDQNWWKEEKKHWGLKFLNSSRAKSAVRSLADFKTHEQKELASLSAEFDSLEAAKPVLADLLKQPGGPFPKAAYLYGRILLDEQDDAGLEHLMVAAKNDSTLTEEATHAGYFYLLSKHGEQAAQEWWERVTPAPAEAA